MRRVGVTLLLGLLSAAPAWAGEVLQVEDAWIREAPPTAQVLGGFMVLRNDSERPVHITGFDSPACARVEMHRSVTENGVAKMIPQDRLTVPAGGQLVLAPGGYHLMLFEPRQPMRAGTRVQLVLHSEGHEAITIQAQVRAGMGQMHHHHH